MTSSRRTTLTFGLVLVGLLLVILTMIAAAEPAVPIGNWTAMASLPEPRASLGVVTHAGEWLYSIGGRNAGESATAAAWRARVQDDGSLAAWQAVSSLPVPLYLHAVVASNGYLYVIGGYDDKYYHNEVWRAQIMADGGLSAWQRDRDYPYSVTLHAAVAADGRIYVSGGDTTQGRTNRVYVAMIGAGGALGPWEQTTALPPSSLYRHAMAATSNEVYVTGGYDGNTVRNETYAARINTDGTLGAWQASTMPVPREYHQAVAHAGRLVLLGGRNSTASGGLARVDSAAIHSDGNLGPWVTEPPLPEPLYRLGAVTMRKYGSEYIYALGGLSGNQYRSAVYRSQAPPTPTPTATPTSTPDAPLLRSTLKQKLVGSNRLQYDIVVENISGKPAYQVIVTNQVPGGATAITILDGGRFQGGPPAQVFWQPGTLSPGATIVLRYIVQVVGAQASAGQPTLSAEFSAPQPTVERQHREVTGIPPATTAAMTRAPSDEIAPETGASSDNTTAATMTVLRAGGRPLIDGDLAEWAGLSSVPLDAYGHYSTMTGSFPSLADLSTMLRAAWTSDTLYFAAAITDDVLIGNDSNNIWEDDIIELALYIAAASRTHQFSICVDGRQTDRGVPVPVSSLVVSKRSVPGGWNMEAAIPTSLLNIGALAAGQQYPFNFALWDDDVGGGGRGQTHLFWQSSDTSSYRTDWGTLSLSSNIYNFADANVHPYVNAHSHTYADINSDPNPDPHADSHAVGIHC